MDDPSPSKKPHLAIDLNEAPPSPPTPTDRLAPPTADTYALVLKYHGNLTPAEGPAVVFPGEAGVGAPRPCGICQRPEARGGTVVCDGCETGFHLACLRSRQRQLAISADWVCGECALTGPTQKRWVLGAAKLLDINEPPPPGDDECVAVPGEQIGRMVNPQDTSSNSGIDGQHSYQKMVQVTNAVHLVSHTSSMTDTLQTCSEAVPHRGLNVSRGFEDPILGSSVRGKPFLSRSPLLHPFKEEEYLNSFRKFITEKGGFLSEGWHVEFIQSPYEHSPNPFALYCAPDGKKFESMYDAALYLGVSSYPLVEFDERSDECGSVQKTLPSRRRKKDLARISAANRSAENQDTMRINSGEEHCPEIELVPQFCDIRTASRATKPYMEENAVDESLNLSVGFPIQYEDFFVLCLGKIDVRAAYHDSHQIWPIGYRSYWHDKVTGSLFQCEVSDGGDAGPVFKVRRRPCSLTSIPNGATILMYKKAEKLHTGEQIESTNMAIDASYNEEEDISMLLSDPNPLEQDFSSCFNHDIAGNSCGSTLQRNIGKPESSSSYPNHYSERSMDPLNKSSLRDVIGEFFVEGRSSSSVWKMVSRTLIDACQEVYRQSGRLQFCCIHERPSFYSDAETLADAHHTDLARFCFASGPNTPQMIRSDSELEASCRLLTNWLDQDRFGLDMGFVQELIETLPESHACSNYHFLNDRINFSLSFTVGSGLLLAIKKNGEAGNEEVPYGLYSEKTGTTQQDMQAAPPLADIPPPPGRSLSNKLSAGLVGDVFQIWEFIWRFYEILGMKEDLSFEELEDELIDPWPCDLNHLKRIEKENQDCKTLHANCSVSLPTGTSDSITHEQNPYKSIPVETAAAREATQVKVASLTHERCCGEVLTKVHISLLKVLVGELLNKVAVFLDPNFDARESKSRRGRKKDIDISSLKELKNELLTVNELTWPELARRYVLAFLLMNGHMESQDVCARESLKVFRCLQGDGGLLCGSLSGIAGMEADALLLAEAERQISDSTEQEKDIVSVDYEDSDAGVASEPAVDPGSNLPEWAQPLEPVRKLPTNVGTRIRKCIFSSLEKNPPEWAKEILEHSISKEVYKGNASGPTKKAVLSILAKLSSGTQHQKPEKAKKGKRTLSIPDFIMKKCRFVLRCAVSADESKTFCNLLGTSLLNSNDNNEKGILGSPAMVSRPLDFRTIDLRLAVGAYGGCHEVFIEDVREVWRNLRTAYGDQPDLMHILERLSQHFESLYEKEVLHVLCKITDHSGAERLDPVFQKELNDILLGGGEIPKAPWEDGVCKVCGIDKDDFSVLLCDKCDSEYHKYCLNPPLARIPEGDWFCPSCVADQHKVQNESQCNKTVASHQRSNLGDKTHTFQGTLHQLATCMEEKEYWEFNTDERIFLLKFLCDEVLNSAILREHLEQCVDKSNNAQQKLYALTIDWRNLKFKEELLAMRAGKEQSSRSTTTSDVICEETASMHANQGRLKELQQLLSNRATYTKISESPQKRASIPSEVCLVDNGQVEVTQNISHIYKGVIEKHVNGNMTKTSQDSISIVSETHTSNGHVPNMATVHGKPFADLQVKNGDELNGQECPAVAPEQGNESAVEYGVYSGNLQRVLLGVSKCSRDGLHLQDTLSTRRNGIIQFTADTLHLSHPNSEYGKTDSGENTTMAVCSGANMSVGELLPSHQNTNLQVKHSTVPDNLGEFEASNLEMNSLRKEISELQNSIASVESQIMLTSLRRDFLGRDSIGRLYWTIGRPGRRPWLVVGESMNSQLENVKTSSTCNLASSSYALGRNTYPSNNQSDNTLSYGLWNSSSLVLYESDTEIHQLLSWLRDDDPREKELKECILQWQRFASYQENVHLRIDPNSEPKSSVGEKLAAVHCLTTKALHILENKYGPCLEPEVSEIPKKRGRKLKLSSDERMYRCECLEPVWPSRHHCLSCHQTFNSLKDLEGHNDAKCSPAILVIDESKESDDQMRGKGIRSESVKGKVNFDDVDLVETSKKGKFDASSKLIKFPRKACPYDIDEICKVFITNDSNKELVQEIGLIGSNGVPSLISSPPMLFDPPVILNRSNKFNADMNKGFVSSKDQLPMSTQEDRSNGSYCVGGNKPRHEGKSLQNCLGDFKGDRLSKTPLNYTAVGGHASVEVKGSKVIQACKIPEPSLRPLVGKVSHIVKQLKMNLLDMEAALPEDTLRPSKSHTVRRCAWRAFVKSAESIFEMVQATVLLEGMIKADYLKTGWWYWSSFSAAAKTSTVSSLALRIYCLDNSIIYIKEDSPTPTSLDPLAESSRLTNKMAGKKRKELTDVGPS